MELDASSSSLVPFVSFRNTRKADFFCGAEATELECFEALELGDIEFFGSTECWDDAGDGGSSAFCGQLI